jgi:bifunctional DNA-binding transcriptional regulator/antitoxin component of YhaV-PrlF toxin-antitoxin module
MTLGMAIQSRIDDIVAEWVRDGKMFTAFEVSLAVKEEGVHERHRNMREYIHQAIHNAGIARGDYSRTLMDVGAPEQAWVYHPVGSNPYEYEPLDRTGHDRVKVPRSALPRGLRNPARLVMGPSGTLSAIPDGAYGTDQRGRVTIPVSLLDAIGVGPGDRVNVLCDSANDQVLISKASGASSSTSPDASYVAEPDGNVRITQSTLEKAGIDGLQSYRIDGTSAVVTVRKFS